MRAGGKGQVDGPDTAQQRASRLQPLQTEVGGKLSLCQVRKLSDLVLGTITVWSGKHADYELGHSQEASHSLYVTGTFNRIATF